MGLEDIAAFDDWLESEDPPYSLLRSVRAWIDGLDDAPWQAPSVEISEMTVPGDYQTRQAIILGIEVIYQEDYSSRKTNLIHVGSIQPRESGG
jgi:hypothetical protein